MDIDNVTFQGFTKEQFDKLADDAVLGYVREKPITENGLKYKVRDSGYTTKSQLVKLIQEL